MVNEICKKKTTAPDTSVGADDGQPLHNSTENSISTFEQEINGDFQNNAESLDEIYRRMQRLTDPHYLHTISMTELYQTAYQSRPPIIDGLLYAGAYILAGAPKIGKSFLVAQIAYHVSTGEALWGYEVHPGTVLYLALEDDFQRIQSRMFRKMKSVQIPYDLFIDLAMYHLRGEDDFEEEIRQGLEQKLDAMLNRQLYSQYKTAPTEEEREQARQEYLDRRGVPQSYRWTTPPWEL